MPGVPRWLQACKRKGSICGYIKVLTPVLKTPSALEMLKAEHHQVLLTVLVLTNIALAAWNFGTVMGVGKYAAMSVVALYDVRPIENMNTVFENSKFPDLLEHFDPWSESPYTKTGLTDLQLAKFHLGCYEVPSGADLSLTGPWNSKTELDAWKKADKVDQTAALLAMQLASGGFKEPSVCRCIDSMLYSKFDPAITAAEVERFTTDVTNTFMVLDPTVTMVEKYLVNFDDSHKVRKEIDDSIDPLTPYYGTAGLTKMDQHLTLTQWETKLAAIDANLQPTRTSIPRSARKSTTHGRSSPTAPPALTCMPSARRRRRRSSTGSGQSTQPSSTTGQLRTATPNYLQPIRLRGLTSRRRRHGTRGCHHCDVLDDGLKVRGSVEFDHLEADGVVCEKRGNPIDLCLFY